MALKIRGKSDISGIKVTWVEHKLSQFTDDITLILDASEKSLQESLLELDSWFAKISGLNINFTKTQVIWFGNKKNILQILYARTEICPETTFKLLRINFDVDLEKIVKINYSERIVQIKNSLNQWS